MIVIESKNASDESETWVKEAEINLQYLPQEWVERGLPAICALIALERARGNKPPLTGAAPSRVLVRASQVEGDKTIVLFEGDSSEWAPDEVSLFWTRGSFSSDAAPVINAFTRHR